MPSWLKQDRVGPILVRQVVGVLLLALIVWGALLLEVNPLQDLDGMSGLWTLFALCLLAPSQWLSAALLATSCFLLLIGVYWLTVWASGSPKAGSAGIGFLFGSGCCLIAGLLSRKQRHSSERNE